MASNSYCFYSLFLCKLHSHIILLLESMIASIMDITTSISEFYLLSSKYSLQLLLLHGLSSLIIGVHTQNYAIAGLLSYFRALLLINYS